MDPWFLEENSETWPTFDSPIFHRILAAPTYATPMLWEDAKPDTEGLESHGCAGCNVTTTEPVCFICGQPVTIDPEMIYKAVL